MIKVRDEETEDVGVCVRDPSAVIVFQNHACRAVCGDALGKTCERACLKTSSNGASTGGPRLKPGQQLHGVRCDVAVFEGANDSVTLIVSREERLAEQRAYFEGRGLTPRETEIATLVLLGHTNQEIVATTGLTKATVRTHLNRVHQKLPSQWLTRARSKGQRWK